MGQEFTDGEEKAPPKPTPLKDNSARKLAQQLLPHLTNLEDTSTKISQMIDEKQKAMMDATEKIIYLQQESIDRLKDK